jgi:catechol 2,3-dioxygenase-like lactoylglutathione lyase family enzyme
MKNPPHNFSEKIRRPKGKVGGYPVQLSAKDLDESFVYATAQFVDLDGNELDEVEDRGRDNATTRKITIPIKKPEDGQQDCVQSGGGLLCPPADGTYVLGSIDGVLTWIETEECA